MTFRVTGNSREHRPDVPVLAQRHEEGHGGHTSSRLALGALSVINALDQLDLVLRNVNLILRSQFRQVLQASLLLCLE